MPKLPLWKKTESVTSSLTSSGSKGGRSNGTAKSDESELDPQLPAALPEPCCFWVSRRTKILLAVAGAVVLIGAVAAGVAVALGGSRGGNGGSSNADRVPSGVTLPESTWAALKDEGSPQSQALHWINTKDAVSYNDSSRWSQRFALATLFFATGGSRGTWMNGANWISGGVTECEWFGVECKEDTTTVSYIGLEKNELDGYLASELVLLTSLDTLRLSENKLAGPLQGELGQLSALTLLHLDGNEFTGTIPPELGQLTNLESLLLCKNSLDGTLPSELAKLTGLKDLYVDTNDLTGAIPPEMSGLTNLNKFEFYDNEISGTMPSTLCGLYQSNSSSYSFIAPCDSGFDCSGGYNTDACCTCK